MAYAVADSTHNAAYAHRGCRSLYGEQGRRSGERTRLPPMFASIPPSVHPLIPPLNPGSDATRGFILLCYCPCDDRFLSGCTGFLPSLKTNQNTKNVIRNVVDEHHVEDVLPLKRYLLIYLFNLFFFGRILALFLGQPQAGKKINSFCFCLDFTQSSTSVEWRNLTIPVFASLLVYF